MYTVCIEYTVMTSELIVKWRFEFTGHGTSSGEVPEEGGGIHV